MKNNEEILTKKVMKLELVLMLLLNSLRSIEGVNKSLLTKVEKILSEGNN
jgi:hypothetical protein